MKTLIDPRPDRCMIPDESPNMGSNLGNCKAGQPTRLEYSISPIVTFSTVLLVIISLSDNGSNLDNSDVSQPTSLHCMVYI